MYLSPKSKLACNVAMGASDTVVGEPNAAVLTSAEMWQQDKVNCLATNNKYAVTIQKGYANQHSCIVMSNPEIG